jgi:hypothetical protein
MSLLDFTNLSDSVSEHMVKGLDRLLWNSAPDEMQTFHHRYSNWTIFKDLKS